MPEEMVFTPETLQQMEPPEQAMIRNTEPIDKPVSCSELLFYAITLLLAVLAFSLHWPPLHTIAVAIAVCFLGFELFQLLIPPRLSLYRIGFLGTVLFQSRLFLS
jgi:hypothetical protein